MVERSGWFAKGTMAHHSPTRTNGEKGHTWSDWSKKEEETPFPFVFEYDTRVGN